MSRKIQQGVWRKIQQHRERLRQRVQEMRTCSECERLAGFWVDYCPHCGASRALKISISPGVFATAIGSEALMLFMQWS